MAADRADDAGIPPDEPSGGPGDTAIPGRAARAETRSRDEYYLSLREKVAVGQRSAAAEEQARTENWNETAELSRQLWTEYRRRWPPGDRQDGISASLLSAERGDLQNDFIEITENEANRLVERIRTRITGSR